MRTKTLGRGLEVSAVGLGCMGFSHAYGAATDDAEATRLIRYAHEQGITLFDSAETYGTPEDPHCNEVLVANALRPVRDEVTIVTKFGIHFDYEHDEPPYPLHLDSTPETIRRSCKSSLKRMGFDHIDLYFQHRMDPNVEPEVVAEAVGQLIAEGKVLHWGISEVTEDYLRRAHAVTPVTAVENRYSMMARWHESLWPTLEELGIGYMAFSPLANGFLTGQVKKGMQAGFDGAAGDYRANMPQFKDENIEKSQALLDMLDAMAADHGISVPQLSLAWMICKKPWLVPIPGSRKAERIAQNAAAGDVVLSADEIARIDTALDGMDFEVFGGNAAAKK